MYIELYSIKISLKLLIKLASIIGDLSVQQQIDEIDGYIQIG